MRSNPLTYAVTFASCQVFMHVVCAFSESYLRAGFIAEMTSDPKRRNQLRFEAKPKQC